MRVEQRVRSIRLHHLAIGDGARHLRDIFEPWSLRRIEARTGLGRGYLAARFNSTAALMLPDFEVLAPLVRMTPVELFTELLPGNEERPRGGALGRSLPGLDSNQEPAG